MTQAALAERYKTLYEHMAQSKKPEYMKHFGKIMTQMMDDMITSSPSKAEDYIDSLEAIKWKNFLTPKEAEMIVARMEPKAPWSREQWKSTMQQKGMQMEEEPYYNHCALYVTMSMIYSDSLDTIIKFAGGGDVFEIIYSLALDKLKDKDGVFNVRNYFGL